MIFTVKQREVREYTTGAMEFDTTTKERKPKIVARSTVSMDGGTMLDALKLEIQGRAEEFAVGSKWEITKLGTRNSERGAEEKPE